MPRKTRPQKLVIWGFSIVVVIALGVAASLVGSYLKSQLVTSPDSAAVALCQAMDVDKNNTVTHSADLGRLRSYLNDPATLKICTSPATANCPNLYSKDLATEMTHQIDSRVAGLAADNATKKLFSTRGSATTSWVRSATVWTARGNAPLDVTGVSPWNSNGGYRKAGTLISPRHIVFANHYALPNGATIVFVDKDNNVVTRTLVDQRQLPADIRVGVLDADVPATIAHYPVLSHSDAAAYLGLTSASTFLPRYVPVLTFTQEGHAIIKDVFSISSELVAHLSSPENTDRRAFDQPLIVGDSGQPGFFVVNNQLVLLLTHFGPGAGPFYGAFIEQVNQAMTDLGGGYQVTKFDLSCFTKP